MTKTRIVGAVLCAGLSLAVVGAVVGARGQRSGGAQEPRPVIVQGAMPVEAERLAGRLKDVRVEKVGGWTFWRGTLNGYPVIVSKTMKGLSNTAAVTALAIERYRPAAIINQGTAGGHDPSLRVYDIVLGKYAVNLGAFKTGYRQAGQGSDPLEWVPMDLMASEGSAGEDPNARTMRRYPADEQLLAVAASVKSLYARGRVVEGVIGSSEVWNSEIDRIQRFHSQYGTTVEEMETAAAAQIAGYFRVPFLGIRVLSNNITNGGKYDGKTGEACQEYVYDVVKAYIASVRKR
ncbi:MAG: 5'-methylthioadenosine/S-adenosylhomocysteine nucleosidase [Blastocatellia bacterium]|nr:5'-methylthioadenosine/S-adenosylhomocysteine nucleosidase [Blastocatellia bacterium]